jgi:hypothetical protein
VSAEGQPKTPGQAAYEARMTALAGGSPIAAEVAPGYWAAMSEQERAAEEAGAQAAINAAPSLIVKVTGKISEEDVQELRAALERAMAARGTRRLP